MVRIFKIWSLSNFPAYNTVLLTLITMLHIRSPEHIHLITKSLYSLGSPYGSAGKKSTCNAGDLGLIPGLGRSPAEGKGYTLRYFGLENSMDCTVHGVAKSQTWLSDFHFPGGSVVKNLPVNARDAGLIPGLRKSPGEENGNPFQYSCLENPMDRGAWWATVHRAAKSWTQLNDWAHSHALF